MSLNKHIYRIWCLFWFVLMFFLIYPFFFLFIQKKSWHPYGRYMNHIWAIVVFKMCTMPTKVEFRFKRDKKKTYIYCSNHSSYLDIPSLAYSVPGDYVFVGKASLAKVPLFGYMFRNLYISVNRDSKISRYKTMIDCAAALDKKISVAIFPEGTIPKIKHPNMIGFKDGAFRLAIEKQVPIIPVTIPYNWIILPDDGKYFPKRHQMKVIFHEPIETTGMTLDDVEQLSKKTFDIIQNELINQNKS